METGDWALKLTGYQIDRGKGQVFLPLFAVSQHPINSPNEIPSLQSPIPSLYFSHTDGNRPNAFAINSIVCSTSAGSISAAGAWI